MPRRTKSKKRQNRFHHMSIRHLRPGKPIQWPKKDPPGEAVATKEVE